LAAGRQRRFDQASANLTVAELSFRFLTSGGAIFDLPSFHRQAAAVPATFGHLLDR
jgi:hypothetical protein